MSNKNVQTEGIEETIPTVKKKNYVVIVPIFFNGKRKEIGETIELTIKEFKEMEKLVTEIKE